jgi:hypothetical protein
MNRTPLIRRLVAIAVAALIPFGAAASSAHAAPSAPQASVSAASDDGSSAIQPCRSSWS